MITKETLKKLREEKIKEILINSEDSNPELPSPLFIDCSGKFNKDNWASGDSILRDFIYYIDETEFDRVISKILYKSDLMKKSNPNYEEPVVESPIYFIASVHRINDDVYTRISISETISDGNYKIRSYEIMWYKDRDSIDFIVLNGKLITEDEYLELLNFIQDYQIYDFKIKC